MHHLRPRVEYCVEAVGRFHHGDPRADRAFRNPTKHHMVCITTFRDSEGLAS